VNRGGSSTGSKWGSAMQKALNKKIPRLFTLTVLFLWVTASSLFAASDGTSLLKPKKEAETQGYIFPATHQEITAAAKKEGKLRVLTSLQPKTLKAMIEAFKRHYPFIEVSGEEITGPDSHQRFLLETKAGTATGWDVFNMAPEFYPDYIPYIKKFDLLGMALQKVLAIPPAMIDPKHRTIISLATTIYGVGYNRNLLSEERAPKNWEDFLKPEFKGKKFLVDVRPTGFANFVPALGEERMVSYATSVGLQEPVWTRGSSRGFVSLTGGEHSLFLLPFYQACLRSQEKDLSNSLQCKLIEPVPAMLRNFNAIANTARNPYSALLWFEFQASAEGQKIIDDFDGLNSFIYAPNSGMAKATQGKKLSLNSWDTIQHTGKWEQMAFKALGFPRGEDGK
jgi:ABC-type Fe3+ transport system substrate-binding protein